MENKTHLARTLLKFKVRVKNTLISFLQKKTDFVPQSRSFSIFGRRTAMSLAADIFLKHQAIVEGRHRPIVPVITAFGYF